jgi:hypothetical protein
MSTEFETEFNYRFPGIQRAKPQERFSFKEVQMEANIVLFGGGRRQSWDKEALMIAATAGIGTAVGAIVGGKKGAAFGAISAGVTRFLMRMLSW